MERHLWLIGMMGSGKTSVGSRLGRRLGRPFVDVDEHIAERTGCSVGRLWGDRGEAAFRSLESSAIDRLADRTPAVFATGGGAILDPANVDRMRGTGQVVWLDASIDTLVARVGNGTNRPLLMEADATTRLEDISNDRRAVYEAAADFVIVTDGLTLDAVTSRIEAWWNES